MPLPRDAAGGPERAPRPAPPHPPPLARRLAHALRHAPDRLLHARRRARALARLRGGPLPHRVLFVCHGNIIRSPFAERLAAATLPDALRTRIEFRSAGFLDPGRPSPPEAIEAAALWGIDLAPHRSRRLTSTELRRATLVVVVEPRQRRPLLRRGCPAGKLLVLGDLDPAPVDDRTIPDPFDRPAIVFLESYRRIERCVAALLAAITPPEVAGAVRPGPVARGGEMPIHRTPPPGASR
ncbi:MAG TPA: hypothetical protein VF158_03875 [Longimicrobiales bacterium]